MADWKDQLFSAWNKLKGAQEKKAPSKTQVQQQTKPADNSSAPVSPVPPPRATVPVKSAKPQPTTGQHPSGIRLNTQANQTREINIGFDLGTAYTKVAYRIIGPELGGFVQLSQGGTDYEKTMIPSVVWMDKEQRLYIASDSIPKGSTAIRFFKMHLAGAGIGPCLGSEYCTETPFYHLVSSYFIYRVLKKARSVIRNDHSRMIGPAQIDWSGNLGIPVGYIESSVDTCFLEVLRTAVTVSNKVGGTDNPNLQEFDGIYQEALAEPSDEAVNFHLTSELEAAISGLTSDIATANGMYGLFDIGGGTMDGAVFYYRRENGSPKINILTALVAPIGFDVAVESMTSSITSEDIRRALKAGSSLLKLNVDEIRKRIHVHVSSVVVIARRKSGVRWPDSMREFPIYLCGGGCHSTWHRDTTIGTWQSNQHGNCGIPPYKQQSLGIPTGIGHGTKQIKDWDRHLVAYGLSFPKGSLADVVGFPKNNPVIEYKQYNYDGVLDERMYEKYGKLL